MSHNIDHTTLNWVKEEIDETLKQARRALEDFVEDQGDVTQLQFTYNYVHQVHGTLQMVELHGAALLTEEMEKLSEALKDNKVENRDNGFEVLMRGIIQLPDYLEKIQSGLKDDPLILLPLLNDIRAARGEAAYTENSLITPQFDTNIDVPVSTHDPEMDGQQLAKRLRHNFQVGLLGFYRNQDPKGSLEKIAKVLSELEQACRLQQVVKTWWVSYGLIELLIEEDQGPSVALNKLLGQIDREVKRLIDQGEQKLEAQPSEELLTELLNYISRSQTQSPRVEEIKERFKLNLDVPNQGDIESARQTLGGPNQELLETVSVAVREYLNQVKDALDLFLRGDRKNLSDLKTQSDLLHKIADTLGMLGLSVPRKIVMDQDEVIQSMINGEREASEATLMDIAHALLKVESALERLAKQKGGEELITEEGLADGAETGKVKLQPSELKDIQGSLLEEVAVNMAKIKDCIVSFIDAPEDFEVLDDVPELFNEVQGGMKIVGLDYPCLMLEATSNYISNELIKAKRKPSQDELDTLADAIASVEYYLEAIPDQKVGIESMLDVAHESLEKLGYPVKRPGEADPASPIDESPFDEKDLGEDTSELTMVGSINDVSFDIDADETQEIEVLEINQENETDSEFSIDFDVEDGDEQALSDVGFAIGADEVESEPIVDVVPLTKEQQAEKAKAASLQLLEDVDDDILSIFVEEAREELEVINDILPKWKNHNDDASLERMRRAFHTLKGSGRLVGASEIGEFAWAFENMLNRVLDQTIHAHHDMIELLEEGVAVLPMLINTIENNVGHEIDVDALSHRAFVIVDHEKAAESKAHKSHVKIPAKSTPKAAVSDLVLNMGKPVQMMAPTPSLSKTESDGLMDPVLYEIFSKESAGHLKEVHDFIETAQDNKNEIHVNEGLIRALHTLHGSARMAGASNIAEIAGLLERFTKTTMGNEHVLVKDGLQSLVDGIKYIEVMLEMINKDDNNELDTAPLIGNLKKLCEHEIAQEKNRLSSELKLGEAFEEIAVTTEQVSVDDNQNDYDVELLEVFLEEGSEILDSGESILQKLAENPRDSAALSELQRELHTLKGGARMAGLTPIGDLSHVVESILTDISDEKLESSTEIVAVLHRALDKLFQMLEVAQQRAVINPVPELVDLIENIRLGKAPKATMADDSPLVESKEQAKPKNSENKKQIAELVDFPVAPTLKKAFVQTPESHVAAKTSAGDIKAATSGSQDVVKVKANLLDNLVNFAGEVSIYRSRLEQQNTAFTSNLGEMDNTVTRLQEQLRKLEIETEAQILFNYEKEGGSSADFDPLEMDRYSQVQELSRGLSESLNDITSIKGLLDGLIRESETLLLQQSRVNTDLQEGLMRTRMVPFSQIVSRLRRIVRQTCQELGKKAELEIVGEQGEIDRTVLERITAPIEHMLRNSVAHGIEKPSKRKALGKPEVGKLTVEIARQGSEVMLQVADDGSGMDLKAIRKKAIDRGLLDRRSEVTDHDILQFILESGFSTAEEVTQISGRGVGMDVVNSEIKQLGGQLEIDSNLNEGTQFTIHLPLTLAVNHALLLNVGDDLYALPLSGIEGIVRLHKDEIAKYVDKNNLHYKYADNEYQVKSLGNLLGSGENAYSSDKVVPVLLVRSGDHRVALQVDNLLGSREIVVKSIGAQLSTVRGISGATILGDGRVVLILDLGGLIRLSASVRSQAAIKQQREQAEEEIVTQPIIMVVDDSITVRKVTTRLLERNNITAVTAKDGIDAIAQLEEVIPDVMLLDIEMPRMDGFELASYIRNEPKLKHIPIIMITSRTGDKHRKRAKEIGVNGYLGKPYQELDLLNHIKELMKDGIG